MGGHCQDFTAPGIQQDDRSGAVSQQGIGAALQVKINAQTDIQARWRLAVNQVIPPDRAGRIALQAAQLGIEGGFQPGLPIGGIGITGDGSQGRILICTDVITGFALGQVDWRFISVKQAAAFHVTVGDRPAGVIGAL